MQPARASSPRLLPDEPSPLVPIASRRSWFRSLGVKLAAATTLVVTVASIAFFTQMTGRERARLIASKQTAAAMITERVAAALGPACDFGEPADVRVVLDELRSNGDIESAGAWASGATSPMAAWQRAGAAVLTAPGASGANGVTVTADRLEAMHTIVNRDGAAIATVGIAFSLRPENVAFADGRRHIFWLTVAMAAVTAALLILVTRIQVVGPLAKLADVVARLGRGDVDARARVEANDEIGDLAKAFNVMSEAVVYRQQRLEKEMEVAREIQTCILPRTLEAPGVDLAACMMPATEVGGDYYDVLPTADGCWFGIGDVAGHGLNAGLIMLMIQSIVAALVLRDGEAPPSEVIRALNRAVFDNVRRRLGMEDHATLTLLHYRKDGRLTFAGAHEVLVVCRAATGRAEVIETPGPWIGGVREIEEGVVDTTVQLAVGDVLFLHTDGLTEARGADGSRLGLERVCGELESCFREPVERIRDRVVGLATAFAARQDDDVTILVARHNGGESAGPES